MNRRTRARRNRRVRRGGAQVPEKLADPPPGVGNTYGEVGPASDSGSAGDANSDDFVPVDNEFKMSDAKYDEIAPKQLLNADDFDIR